MWNGPQNVVYKRYMSCRDRPQMNYYNLFFVTRGELDTSLLPNSDEQRDALPFAYWSMVNLRLSLHSV